MNNYLSPAELLASYSAAGVRKMERSAASLLLLGALAGAIIAIAAAATNTAVYGISDTWTVRTICGLLFPFGLGLVVVTGAELFTGNCMLPLTLLEKKGGSAVLMVRNWALVFAGNALGSLLVAWLCVSCGQLDYSAGALAVYTIRVGAAKCALPFGSALGLGVLCNLLVCLGVLAAASARETPGRLMGAFLPVCFFVLCGFEHSVANLYYIGAALMAAAVPQYASLAAAAGVDLAHTLDRTTMTTPIVQVGGRQRSFRTSMVGIDENAAMESIVAHLAEQGVRSAAYLAGKEVSFESAEMFAMFHTQMRTHRLVTDTSWNRFGDSTVERGYQCVWRMFADSDARPPEAVICADDMIALGAMIALQTLGIRVPDDVRVVGYDDSPLALTTMPTLTSVRPPFLQIVTEALRLIGQGPDQAAHISLLPQLIVRGSTVVRS